MSVTGDENGTILPMDYFLEKEDDKLNFTKPDLVQFPMSNISQLVLLQKLQEFVSNRAIDDRTLIVFLTCYVLLIITGAIGNGMVCMVVARKPHMRTARNVFIINLAISDLILCLFTMPFSLIEIVLKFWPLGIVTCKLVAGLQATSIFVSTISITAIALDRYTVIIYPTQDNCKPLKSVLMLSSIWLFSLLLSTPLFVFRTVDHIHVGLPWLESVDYCLERWPIDHGRGFYSMCSIILQYVFPIIIVSVAYARISNKLKYRIITKGTKHQERQARDLKRMQKTNGLLIAIAVSFVISWLPLNILNLVADFCYPFAEDYNYNEIFATCHMMGMSSACSNPIFYGWFNENFRKEFKEIFKSCSKNRLGSPSYNAPERTESVLLCNRSNNMNTSVTPT